MKKISLFLMSILCAIGAIAQTRDISGQITDQSDGSSIPGVNIVAKGSGSGTSTDGSGNYVLRMPTSTTTIVVSAIGYTTQEIAVTESSQINIVMIPSSEQLNEVVVTVGRGAQRTIIDNPVPVDNFNVRDLNTTGQMTFDKALQYRVPSFNSINTPVNDATTLLDPYEIRNLGPSRTLILINGKRKNLSSLLYVQFSPGRGETGADLSAIPTAAIKRVEILRDGASAQYGSDAIAGVMNVILNDRYEYSTLNVTSGITGKGDGKAYGLSFNSGSNIGSRGFINYTLNVNKQNSAVRSTKIDPLTEIATFGDFSGPDPINDPANANIVNYLAKYPTGNNINGSGDITTQGLSYNLGLPIGEKGLFYSNGAYVAKKALSFANFRTPYWRTDAGLLHVTDPNGINYTGDNTLNGAGVEIYKGYIGYVPTFNGDLLDYNATVGVKNETNGWNHDVSLTFGGNKQTYSVDNTVNRSLGTASPTSFKPGGYSFKHVVANLDLSRAVTDKLFVALGSEARSETYQIIAGDTASYSLEGSNSFPGIRAENARTNTRTNIGVYGDVTYDFTKNFLVEGAYRIEQYSDFGTAKVGKISSRLKLADDKVVLRGSYSTGFRAPTLHQIYAQSTQASFAAGSIVLSGLFNNNSKEAFLLGIPKLKAEKSTNITFGMGLNLMENLSISVDYYNINIKDRVVYSSSINTADKLLATPTTELGRILKGNATGAGNFDLASVQFFLNGIETQTDGIDVVANYRDIAIGNGKLGINLAGNFTTRNDVVGAPNNPPAIQSAGASILSTQITSLLTRGRPRYKAIGGLDYAMGKLNVVLSNTLFGPTEFQDLDNGGSDMENIKQEFTPAVVTDLNVGYNFSKNLSASFSVNNLFDILPSWKLKALNPAGESVLNDPQSKQLLEGFLAFSGRYSNLLYNGSQFSQLGRMFNVQFTYKF